LADEVFKISMFTVVQPLIVACMSYCQVYSVIALDF